MADLLMPTALPGRANPGQTDPSPSVAEASNSGSAEPSGPAATVRETEAGPGPGALVGTVAEHLVVAVAPSTGRFRPATDDVDDRAGDHLVVAGSVLGHVTGGRGRADRITAPEAALLRRWLARPGQVVRRGQPLAWLERPAGATI